MPRLQWLLGIEDSVVFLKGVVCPDLLGPSSHLVIASVDTGFPCPLSCVQYCLSHPVSDCWIVSLCAIKQHLHFTQRGMHVETLWEEWCYRNVSSTTVFLLWARKWKCKKQIPTLFTLNADGGVGNDQMQGQIAQGQRDPLSIGKWKQNVFLKVILWVPCEFRRTSKELGGFRKVVSFYLLLFPYTDTLNSRSSMRLVWLVFQFSSTGN